MRINATDAYNTIVQASNACGLIYHTYRLGAEAVHNLAIDMMQGNLSDDALEPALRDMRRMLDAYRDAAPAMDELEYMLSQMKPLG